MSVKTRAFRINKADGHCVDSKRMRSEADMRGYLPTCDYFLSSQIAELFLIVSSKQMDHHRCSLKSIVKSRWEARIDTSNPVLFPSHAIRAMIEWKKVSINTMNKKKHRVCCVMLEGGWYELWNGIHSKMSVSNAATFLHDSVGFVLSVLKTHIDYSNGSLRWSTDGVRREHQCCWVRLPFFATKEK